MTKTTWGGRRDNQTGRPPEDEKNPLTVRYAFACSEKQRELIRKRGTRWCREILIRELRKEGEQI